MRDIIDSTITVIFFATVVVVVWLSFSIVGLKGRITKLECQVNILQELQQEKLNAFSKDVHNMTGVMELLETQAEILQEIERRTR